MTPLEVATLVLGIIAILSVGVAIGFYIFLKKKFRGAPLVVRKLSLHRLCNLYD